MVSFVSNKLVPAMPDYDLEKLDDYRWEIPRSGDMGRYSYVLVGTEKAMGETFGSTCHGAGLSQKVAQLRPLGVIKG